MNKGLLQSNVHLCIFTEGNSGDKGIELKQENPVHSKND